MLRATVLLLALVPCSLAAFTELSLSGCPNPNTIIMTYNPQQDIAGQMSAWFFFGNENEIPAFVQKIEVDSKSTIPITLAVKGGPGRYRHYAFLRNEATGIQSAQSNASAISEVRCGSDPCSPNPCQNGGTCRALAGVGACKCFGGFSGLHCEIAPSTPCSPNPCLNGGMCKSFSNGTSSCACARGYTGVHCEVQPSNPCDPNPCEHGGICSIGLSGSPVCTCIGGYSGNHCQITPALCTSNPCKNGGTCIQTGASYKCNCTPGFAGTDCGSPVNPHPSPYPFDLKLDLKGSQFQVTYMPRTGIYNYEEVWFFSGLASQFPSIPRVADATIRAPFEGDNITQSFTSECTGSSQVDYASYALLISKSHQVQTSTVFTTVVCGYDYSSTCDNAFPCLNGGLCSSSTKQCSCPSGFVGNKCEVRNTLAGTDLCKGYLNTPCNSGSFPSDLPSDATCQNGGKLHAISSTEYVCLCQERFVGANCEYEVIPSEEDPCAGNPCQNEGICQQFDSSTYKCTCKPGFAGANCETQLVVDACKTRPCVNGNCLKGLDGNGFYCQCPKGFAGQYCDIPVSLNSNMCDAANNPCLHNGECIIAKDAGNVIQYRYCQCTDNWVGPFCEFEGRERTITVENRCGANIWPAIQGNPLPLNGGFKLDVNSSKSFNVPSNWISTRVWARTGCSEVNVNGNVKLMCETGDCSNGLECNGAGSDGVSLAEFTLGTSDTYDVSLVDGFNIPVAIVPSHIAVEVRSEINFIYAQCRSTYCANDVNLDCPIESQVVKGGNVVACLSSCNTYKTDAYCCKGAFATPETCARPVVSERAKSLCPLSYTYAYDDHTSTFTCPDYAQPDYTIVFCP